jgi:hypothetical protein
MIENRIIHICEDEKFINSSIEQFEFCFPNKNEFYVFKKDIFSDFIHVKPQIFVKKTTKEELVELTQTISPQAIIVLHSLSNNFYDFVLHLHKSNKIIWFCFGFEVYNDSNYFKSKALLDKITRVQFPDKKRSLGQKIKERLKPYYRLLKSSFPLSAKEKKNKVMLRINYLGSSFKEEFLKVSKLIGQKKLFFDFWYYPLELIVDVNKNIYYPKKNILIGNSGFKTGNHLDVFAAIKNYNLVSNKIIVPLNYGIKEYINTVVAEGEQCFSEKYCPFLEFVSLQEYNAVLEEVGVAILNNKRQQAVGNTIGLLWLGAKVFLNKENPFYHYLKRIGIIVFCYQTELNEKSCNEYLSLEQIEVNRSILFTNLNREKLAAELKQQINNINA